MADLHRRFADMLLKLNCYDDFAVYSTDEKAYGRNPSPERLFSLLCQEQADLCIVLPDEHAMIAVNHDDTCMTVYHPSETLRHRIAQLAGAEGLFFWQPPDAKGNAL